MNVEVPERRDPVRRKGFDEIEEVDRADGRVVAEAEQLELLGMVQILDELTREDLARNVQFDEVGEVSAESVQLWQREDAGRVVVGMSDTLNLNVDGLDSAGEKVEIASEGWTRLQGSESDVDELTERSEEVATARS